MNNKDENILGYIELDTGTKAITPMNDVFLNYTFRCVDRIGERT